MIHTKNELLGHPRWEDWKWHLQHRIKHPDELATWLTLTESELKGLEATKAYFRWQITPYYASLMDPDDPDCPIRRQVVPRIEELTDDDIELDALDPLEELAHSPVKNVIHNYGDRVAFCISSECAVYCRYCLRKRMVGDSDYGFNRSEISEGISYIASQPAIRDVLLTGGDPLILSDSNLEWVIAQLHSIPHVELIRIGSRLPVLNPFRITPELCSMIEKYHPIWVNTHFNHVKECTVEAKAAADRLTRTGAPLGNQTVLLRGINDSVESLTKLFTKLTTFRIRPYYLYQAQLIGGTQHFRTSIEKGRALMNQLRGRISGFAIPTYVLDTPHGKVPLTPDGLEGRDGEDIIVRSYSGKVWRERNPL